MTARYSEFADAERRSASARADIAKGISLPGPRLSEWEQLGATVGLPDGK